MSAYCRFCATKCLNIGVRVCLTEVSAEHRFILQQMWEENLGTQAGVHLIEGVRLIWGPLNTRFSVQRFKEHIFYIILINFIKFCAIFEALRD